MVSRRLTSPSPENDFNLSLDAHHSIKSVCKKFACKTRRARMPRKKVLYSKETKLKTKLVVLFHTLPEDIVGPSPQRTYTKRWRSFFQKWHEGKELFLLKLFHREYWTDLWAIIFSWSHPRFSIGNATAWHR